MSWPKGISTSLFEQQHLTVDQLQAATARGFERVEIFALKPHFDYQNRQATRTIASWLNDQGPLLHSLHTPFCLDYQAGGCREWLSIGSPDRLKRERAIDHIRWSLEFCELVPCNYAVVHMGAPEDRYSPRILDAIYYSLDVLVPFAAARGVSLAMENIPNELGEMERLLRFLEETGLRDVHICFDTGHANLRGACAPEIKMGGESIATLHLHDNDGKKDSHLLPFEGTLDWTGVLEALETAKYSGPLVLELKAQGKDPEHILDLAFATFQRFDRTLEELADARSRED
ncbi:MAG: sugar phosphate isomerase/epimerase family protein [Acidobacteriota bacterium]